MKLKSYIVAASLGAGLLIANSANAQWLRNAGTGQTYTQFLGDSVGIGTSNPKFKLDIQATGIATLSFKSATSNSSILLDRGAANATSSLTYRSLGVNVWQTGIVGNDNFTIRNNQLASVAIFCSNVTNNVGIGNTAPANRLTVTGNADFTGRVGVGTNAPAAKLHVLGGIAAGDTVSVIQGIASFTGSFDVIGVYGAVTTTAAGYGYGVIGDANYTGVLGNGSAFGVQAFGGAVGVDAESAGIADTTDATGFVAHGVDAFGGSGNESAGIQAVAGGAKYNYGVLGYCGPNYSAADSDNTHKNWAGYFAGDLIASRFYKFSDAKLKNNIQPIESALSKLSKIQTSTYTFKLAEFPQLGLPFGNQIGFIAENMETVFPELVKEARSPSIIKGRDHNVICAPVTFKSVDYEGMIPVVVAAINEQSAKESEMNSRITQLENEIAELKSMLQARKGNVTETGSLLQNVPNPANGSTTISFYLPENSRGVLQVTDAAGKVVKSFNVSGSGMQDVTVNTASLSSGSYTYSLSVNGKVADSKTMVINK